MTNPASIHHFQVLGKHFSFLQDGALEGQAQHLSAHPWIALSSPRLSM